MFLESSFAGDGEERPGIDGFLDALMAHRGREGGRSRRR